jgi:hypothetical protein
LRPKRRIQRCTCCIAQGKHGTRADQDVHLGERERFTETSEDEVDLERPVDPIAAFDAEDAEPLDPGVAREAQGDRFRHAVSLFKERAGSRSARYPG